MRAEIIAIGSELISGQIARHQQPVAQPAALGCSGSRSRSTRRWATCWKTIVAAFRIACERADLVVMSGGLGPTQDDLTREALAEVAGVPLVEDPARWRRSPRCSPAAIA